VIKQAPYFENLACEGIQIYFKESKTKKIARKPME